MTKEHFEDVKEVLKLSKQERKNLKKAGVVYSMFSVAGICTTLVFSYLKMPMEAVTSGLTSVSCAVGVLYFKLEEKQVCKEIKRCEEKLKEFER